MSLFFGVSFIINKNVPTKIHEGLIKNIRMSAYKYGLDNIEYFKSGYEMYISVDSLVTNGYLKGNDNSKTMYIDNLTGNPFEGLIYIYYSNDKVHTEYLENFSDNEKSKLIQKKLSIVLNSVTSNLIDISVLSQNLLVYKYEYYLNDRKIEESNLNHNIYSGLLYDVYRIKVIAYTSQGMFEANAIISLKQLPLPTFEINDKILTIVYPNDVDNYVFEYQIDNGNWNKTSNQVEKIEIDKDMIVKARVFDGYNFVIATQTVISASNENLELSHSNKYEVTFDLNGGSGKFKEQIVIESSLAIQPLNNPTKLGYEFIGWYLNDKLYDFNTPVNQNIVLTAKWSLKETERYQVEFDLNGGSGTIAKQTVEKGNIVTAPRTPQRQGYTFNGWYLNDNLYSFNIPVTSDIKLIASWIKLAPTYYTVKFDLDGGTGNISDQTIEAGNKASKPNSPTKSGYEFIGWYLNDSMYNFDQSVNQNLTLKAKYYAVVQSITSPIINYEFSSNTNGKWIFINNPEKILSKYLTDNSGKSIYSNFINGTAEIYYEHYVNEEVSMKMKYGIRFYNPNDSSVTLKINKCGSSIVRGNGDIYIDTWKEYYGFSTCKLSGKSFEVAPYSSVMIYLNVYSTGSGWSDWACNFTTSLPNGFIPTSVIDGVLNVTSSNKLNVEAFIFNNSSSIPKASYDKSDNYVDSNENRLVYSGYYNKLPYLTSDVQFTITDNTPKGPLNVKYSNNSNERDSWYTHDLLGNGIGTDCIKPITYNNTVSNWGNWAVHYTENIIINNTSNSTRRIAYYINSYYANNADLASAIVAFPKNNNINYYYKRNIIGKWHTNNNFEKVWEVIIPANTTITVPTEVLLGGNSAGTIGRKIELIN